MFVIRTVCVTKVIHYVYQKWVPVPVHIKTTSDEERDKTKPFHELGTLPDRWIDTYLTETPTPEMLQYKQASQKWTR